MKMSIGGENIKGVRSFAMSIGLKKTILQRFINSIKNIFRSKSNKLYSIKFYLDDKNYIEEFATIEDINIGRIKGGFGTFSISGKTKKWTAQNAAQG